MKEESTVYNRPEGPKKSAVRRLSMFALLILACVIAVGGGLVIGYVRLGGQPLPEVWKIATWRHLYDLIFS